MTDLEAARQQWLANRQRFAAFAANVAEILSSGVRRAGIFVQFDHRAKEMDSLIKKLITKPQHTYESLPDKAGVRIIVRYKHEIDSVLEIAGKLLDCDEPENKADFLKVDTFGYLSVHAQVKLRADHKRY